MEGIYLGRAIAPSNGDIRTAYPVPAGVSIGDCVLQFDGYTDGRQVRNVNLGLRILARPTTSTLLRRGCVFAPGSAVLTRSCERYLRLVASRIPKSASGVSITIIGAATDRATRAANRTLARQRATSVRFYLRALRVKGTYAQVLVTKKGKPKGPVAAQVVIVRKGIPRTTVIIAFRR